MAKKQLPRILIYGNVYETTVGQSIPYLEFFQKFGEVIIVTSEMDLDYWVQQGDILAVPGGQDVLSTRYNRKPGFRSKNVNGHYEWLDMKLLMPWLATGKPIIGICRGMQTLNVALGGSLHVHVEGHEQDQERHYRSERLQKMYTSFPKHEIYMINSFHHQAVKEIAPGFMVLGWGDVDDDCPSHSLSCFEGRGWDYISKSQDTCRKRSTDEPMLPEIMKHQTLPYVAFQYHPEEFNCPLAIQLIKLTLKEYAAAKEKTNNEAPTYKG